MAQNNLTIPWTDEGGWAEVVLSISKSVEAMGAKADTMKKISQKIVQAYADIETVLDMVCLASCPACSEVCCTRATVWYDLKDLLTVYLSTGELCDKQIYRRSDHSCCNLTPSGCRLIRSERPFICTWYICPNQKNVFDQLLDKEEKTGVFRLIHEMKRARKELEQFYVKAVCN